MNGVTVFLGLKGGVGTTAAVVRQVRAARAPLVAVDLDLAHGDLAQRLGVETSSTIADLCILEDGELDTLQIGAVRYPVPRSPASVVPSPSSPELAEVLTSGRVAEVLQILSGQAAVIVDGGSRIDVPVLHSCLLADRVVLVARSDSSCLRMAALVGDLLDRAGARAPRFLLVRGRRRAASAFAAEIALPQWPLEGQLGGRGTLRPGALTHMRAALRRTRWRAHA